jgi:hypothetical protein
MDNDEIEESDDDEEGDESDRQFLRNVSDDGKILLILNFILFKYFLTNYNKSCSIYLIINIILN